MKTADLNAAIAAGEFKITRLPSVAPKPHQLTMTRVAAGKSFALPSYDSVRSAPRAARDTVQMGKRGTYEQKRRLR